MPRNTLFRIVLIPMLLGLGSFGRPGPTVVALQQLRSRAAAGSLELVAHDPRGRPVLQADECELELRRDGKRVWRRRLSFGVREVALAENGRVVLVGEDRRDAFGMDANVSVLCFLGTDGETLAVHESAHPRQPRRKRIDRHGLCAYAFPPEPPLPENLPLEVDRLLPMGGEWTLAVASVRVDGESEWRWQIYDELGRRLGEVDRHDLLPDAPGDVRCLSLDIVPETRWAVAVWQVSGSEPASTQLVVHDLGARFAQGLSARKLEPLWSGTLDLDFPLLRTEVVHGTDPSVRIGVWKEFPESARYIVRRGPNGAVAVEEVAVGKRR